MIELKFTGMCKDCKTPRLELDSVEVKNLDNEYETYYTVKCEHAQVCKRWIAAKERAYGKGLNDGINLPYTHER